MKTMIYSIIVTSALLFASTASANSTTTNITGTGSKTFSINVADTLFNASFDGLGVTGITLTGPTNYSFGQNAITDLWEFSTTNFVPGLYSLNVAAVGAWTGQYTTTIGTFIPAAPVPEPETNMMMLFGLLALVVALGKPKSA